MSDYRVNLDIFAGPMDLLLYLVRREEVDIYDIPIAEITDQYIRYIEVLKSLDIDLAGDFLVMASTLLQIKSAMLLPKTEDEGGSGGEDLTDPRAELIRQLLEYKKFKDAANLLSAAADETGKRFARPGTIIEQLKPGGEPEVDIERLSVWDLLEAFGAIVEATSGVRFDVSHIKDDTPIDLYQIEILHRLQTEGPKKFEQIFEGRTRRIVMIGLFLAILELIREKLIAVEQHGESIYLRALTEENAEQAVQKAIFTLSEAGNGQPAQVKEAEKPPIPIAEMPPEGQQKAQASIYEEAGQANEKQPEN
ncbi:MAG: segregation/condensation protein A [Sedimentisphaerales bacterium]|nr:segregation/condensation protein A [Sedimentisphaerales bacterium]